MVDFARTLAKSPKPNKVGTPVKELWRFAGTISHEDARLPRGQRAAKQYPLIFEEGYAVYLPTLAFDSKNRMHVFWNWRHSQAGMDTVRPSHGWPAIHVRRRFAIWPSAWHRDWLGG